MILTPFALYLLCRACTVYYGVYSSHTFNYILNLPHRQDADTYVRVFFCKKKFIFRI